MKKIKIAIASILKPVDDPRAYRKIAVSLRETNKYHLNIIGFCTKNKVLDEKIKFTPIFCKKRNHPSRFWAPLRALKHFFKYRPDILIINTYELIPVAIIGKLCLGYKLLYDVQENYRRNVRLNNSLPTVLIPVAAFYIGLLEALGKPFIHDYLLAERCYEKELPGFRPCTVLTNKYAGKKNVILPVKFQEGQNLTFLISGTITPVYGIENAINWFRQILFRYPEFQLRIIGHCPLEKFARFLHQTTENIPQIILELSDKPIPAESLTEAISATDIQLLPYHLSDSIKDKIPTKIYELMGMGKPFLISQNPLWESLYEPYKAGMGIDFFKPSKALIDLEQLMQNTFFTKDPSSLVSWESEAAKLIKRIGSL